MPLKFQPLNQFILLRQTGAIKVNEKGILIPEKSQRKPFTGVIIAMAPDCGLAGRSVTYSSSTMIVVDPPPYSVGDTIHFSQVGCGKIDLDGEEFVMLKAEAVLGWSPAESKVMH